MIATLHVFYCMVVWKAWRRIQYSFGSMKCRVIWWNWYLILLCSSLQLTCRTKVYQVLVKRKPLCYITKNILIILLELHFNHKKYRSFRHLFKSKGLKLYLSVMITGKKQKKKRKYKVMRLDQLEIDIFFNAWFFQNCCIIARSFQLSTSLVRSLVRVALFCFSFFIKHIFYMFNEK